MAIMARGLQSAKRDAKDMGRWVYLQRVFKNPRAHLGQKLLLERYTSSTERQVVLSNGTGILELALKSMHWISA
jgi:hypothetical protein